MSEKNSESKQKTTNSENQSSTIRAYATQLESLRNTNSLLEQKIITLNNQLEANKSDDNKDIIQELRDEVY